MQIAAQLTSNHLSIQITVTNELAETLYLQNWLFDWYGQLGVPELDKSANMDAAPTRDISYACLGKHGELVLLSGDGPERPDGLDEYAPRLPYATRLRPGETYQGRLRLSLPIREWSAYEGPQTTPTQPIRSRKIRYRLETVGESAFKGADVVEHVNFRGAFRAGSAPCTFIEATTQVDEPFTILQRTDRFQRFG